MSKYFLAAGVHVCISADHVVFLDERCAKYLGVPLHRARGLQTAIHEWPMTGEANAPADPALLETLLRRGLITRDSQLGKPATPVRVDISDVWHGDRWLDALPAIRPMHVMYFVLAVIYAAALMRWMPLARIMRRARERKLAGHGVDGKQLAELMNIYERLRPWLYTRKDACMLHSLAVMEFLARFGIVPDWIVGVRTSPFRAHSWLQHGDQAITDSPLKLARLTPLLKI